MFRHMPVAAALSLLFVVFSASCSDDGNQSDWDIDEEFTDVADDGHVDTPTVTPLPDSGEDTRDSAPDEIDCPVGEVEYPAETLQNPQLHHRLGEVPRLLWTQPIETFDEQPGEPNGPPGMARGMMHDHEGVDLLVVPTYMPATAEGYAYLYSLEFDANTGQRWGGSGSGLNPDDYEQQIRGLPAPILFPDTEAALSLSASQPAPDNEDSPFGPKLNVDLSLRSDEWGTGSYGTPVEGLSRGTVPMLSHAVVLPSGRGAVVWDGRQVLGLHKALFDATTFPFTTLVWTLELAEMWPDAPSGTELTWLKSPSADEMLVLARHAPDTGEPVADRLFRIDACGNHKEVFRADGIGSDLLKVGDNYLIRAGARDGSAEGSHPLLVADGQTIATLDATCRDLVQTETDKFACLSRRADGAGFEILTFDDSLELVDTRPIDPAYTYARLTTAAHEGGFLLVALTEQDDQTTAGHLLVVHPERTDHYELPEADQWEPTSADVDNTWPVLTPRGIVAVAWSSSIVGIQTDLPGMAQTAFPRAHYGGNQNRGYIDVDP
jgi:hypothetical protein